MARSSTPRSGARSRSATGKRPSKPRASTGKQATRKTTARRPSPARRKASRRTARRASTVLIATLVTMSTLIVVGFVGVLALAGGAFRAWGDDCTRFELTPFQVSLSSWDAEQRAHAAVIMTAGDDLGLSPRDQTIAVMTAMGESSLRNLEYGDWETSGVTNPDGSRTTSVGLFQQQDSWGSLDQRMDPRAAAILFYRAMVKAVPDAERTGLDPTLVAHRTQINSDPQHYARYWPAAVALVEQISGQDTGLAPEEKRAAACG